MTALLVFLKIIAYTISIPALTVILFFITIALWTLKIVCIDDKSEFYACGYIKGKLGLSLSDEDYNLCKNKDNYKEFSDGYNNAREIR